MGPPKGLSGLFQRKKENTDMLKEDEPSQYFSEELLDTDTDEDIVESGIPGQKSYKTPKRSTSTGHLSGRGRKSDKEESKRRERSKSSRSTKKTRSRSAGALKKSSVRPIDGRSTAEESSTMSRRATRKIKVSPEDEESPGAQGADGDQLSNTLRATNRRVRPVDMRNVGEASLTGIEIRLDGGSKDDDDNDSTGPLNSLSKKKKKSIRRRRSKESDDDDETASRGSRGSMGTLRRKKSTKKKSAGDSASVADDSLTSPLSTKKKTKVKRSGSMRSNRSDILKEVKEDGTSQDGKKKFDDSIGSDIAQSKRSSRSITLDFSPQKPSLSRNDLENDSTTDGSVLGGSVRDLVSKFNKKTKKSILGNSDSSKLSLEKAIEKINILSDDLLIQKQDAAKAKDELKGVMFEMNSISKQNEKLHKSLDAVEKDLAEKEDNLQFMEQLVKEHFDRVEYLEQQLEETEEELFAMDDDMKKSGVQRSSEDETDRANKMNSIKAQREERLSFKKSATGRSVRDLLNVDGHDESTQQQKSDLAARERKLEELERRLEVERERNEAREKNLAEREAVLLTTERRASRAETGNDPLTTDSDSVLISDLKAECADLIAEKEAAAEAFHQRIKDKHEEIVALQKKLGTITEEFEERNARELLGKDATIRQLEEELIATRAVIDAKTSDQLSVEMKGQIKSLGDQVRNLTKRLRSQQATSKAALQEKEQACSSAQREAAKLQREVNRLEERERERANSTISAATEDSKLFIVELEHEISHWKQVNAELEEEVVLFKNEAAELRNKLDEEDDNGMDDDASVGSFTSHISRQSMRQSRSSMMYQSDKALDMSLQESFSSLSKGDTFFAPKSVGAGSTEDADETSSVDLSTSSKRAMRTVSSLWSKMTQKPQQTAGGLYQMSFDD